MKWFDKLYEKKISATGLAVFRIAFFLNFFFEVLFIFKNRQFLFDYIPFLKPFELDFTIPLIIWLIVVLGIVIGLYTRFLLVLNYFFVLIFIASLSSFEYHMDYIYTGVCFLVMFIPLSNCMSVDNIIYNKKDNNVSQLYYFFIVFIGIGLVYFDSVLHKFSSQLWLNGLGVWLPASVPQMTILNDQWLLNQKGLMLFLGYLTLVFEAFFVFLFWVKKLRIWLFIIGFGLHIGIFMEFPIPQFALGMLALYVLMVPVSFWNRILNKIGVRFKKQFTVSLLNGLNYLPKIELKLTGNKRGFKYLFLVLILFQLNTSFTAPFVKPIKDKVYLGLNKIHLKNAFNDCHQILLKISKNVLGITRHGVFVDSHFKDYNHIVGIVYKEGANEVWLPFIKENGIASSDCTGSIWAYLGFRMNNAKVNPHKFELGVKRFTSFWAHKNDIDLSQAEFRIKVKRIDLPNWEWEENYLVKQLQKPWQNAGTLIWENNTSKLTLIKSIEEF